MTPQSPLQIAALEEMPHNVRILVAEYTEVEKKALYRFLGASKMLGYVLCKSPASRMEQAKNCQGCQSETATHICQPIQSPAQDKNCIDECSDCKECPIEAQSPVNQELLEHLRDRLYALYNDTELPQRLRAKYYNDLQAFSNYLTGRPLEYLLHGKHEYTAHAEQEGRKS